MLVFMCMRECGMNKLEIIDMKIRQIGWMKWKHEVTVMKLNEI